MSTRRVFLTGGGAVLLVIALVSIYLTSGPGGRTSRGVVVTAQPTSQEATVAYDFRAVFSAVLGVFADQKVPVSFASREKGIIRTASVKIAQTRLKQLVEKRFEPVVERLGKQGGRYVLEVSLSRVGPAQTKVKVDVLLVVTVPESANPMGGQDVPSNGTLETEFLKALANKLRS